MEQQNSSSKFLLPRGRVNSSVIPLKLGVRFGLRMYSLVLCGTAISVMLIDGGYRLNFQKLYPWSNNCLLTVQFNRAPGIPHTKPKFVAWPKFIFSLNLESKSPVHMHVKDHALLLPVSASNKSFRIYRMRTFIEKISKLDHVRAHVRQMSGWFAVSRVVCSVPGRWKKSSLLEMY